MSPPSAPGGAPGQLALPRPPRARASDRPRGHRQHHWPIRHHDLIGFHHDLIGFHHDLIGFRYHDLI
jgi:hypothetical protein